MIEGLSQYQGSLQGYSGFSGFSGVSKMSKGFGVLKLQKKSLDRITCMMITKVSAGEVFIRVQNMGEYQHKDNVQEFWYRLDDFTDCVNILDIDK